MQLSEFKAWFEGYTEEMEGPPSKKEWERIKAKIAMINGVPITYPVYIDRYQPYLYPIAQRYFTGTVMASGTSPNINCAASAVPNEVRVTYGGMSTDVGPVVSVGFNEGFDSHAAMHRLGKAEYAAA
jgi:hypothetical protein